MIDPVTGNTTVAIGQIAAGQIQTFVPLKKVENNESVGNITVGPDGNLWFPISYGGNSTPDIPTEGAIGRITVKGNVKIITSFPLRSSLTVLIALPPGPSDIISGPDGKLWYQGTVHGTTGIARISTSGKLGPVIPDDNINSNMVPLPNGQVWFEPVNILPANELGVATRSGIVATQDLPESSPNLNPGYSMTIGPDGNLWATTGASSIVRISGLETLGKPGLPAPPKRATDYSYEWTNITGSAKPTFAGVAKPGAEVTLWRRTRR